MTHISVLIGSLALLLTGCGDSPSRSHEAPTASAAKAPPLPERAAETDFRNDATAIVQPSLPDTTAGDDGDETEKPGYWGLEPGEPQPLKWEDLMPEGAEEELIRQQDEFFAMLEQRYAANATSLTDIDPYAPIEEGSEFDYMPQFGNFDVVEELDGELIRIPGYVVPFDFDTESRHTEFLFVPYMGACIHSPPPPPNQVIYVKADPGEKVPDIWAPYWLEGTMSTQKHEHEVGDAAYTLTLSRLEPYLGGEEP